MAEVSSGFSRGEARGKGSSVEEQLDKILAGLVRLLTLVRFTSSLMMGLCGFTSIVFLDVIYVESEESLSACAFIIRSMMALQPYLPVTRIYGESTSRSDTTTFSTFSPRISLITLQRFSHLTFASFFDAQTYFFISYSLSC
mgnify:CR=1 FL=1